MKNTIRIATRQSPLALWQAEEVKRRLTRLNPDLSVELVAMTTKGDQLLGSPLAKIGGKGLFIKELEVAMLDGRADIAVHSVKDLPAQIPEGFILGPILARENPFDAFVSNSYTTLDELPQGAKLGTCSLRRKAQLLSIRPDLEVLDLRGNVNTRLAKLDAGVYDAIILAAAGLTRLQMEDRIQHTLDPAISLPAVGQGAIGIELKEGDNDTLDLIQALDCAETRSRISAERALNARLNGGCQAPIAGFAIIEKNTLKMTARIATTDGRQLLEQQKSGAIEAAEEIGRAVASTLLEQGGRAILTSLGISPD